MTGGVSNAVFLSCRYVSTGGRCFGIQYCTHRAGMVEAGSRRESIFLRFGLFYDCRVRGTVEHVRVATRDGLGSAFARSGRAGFR